MKASERAVSTMITSSLELKVFFSLAFYWYLFCVPFGIVIFKKKIGNVIQHLDRYWEFYIIYLILENWLDSFCCLRNKLRRTNNYWEVSQVLDWSNLKALERAASYQCSIPVLHGVWNLKLIKLAVMYKLPTYAVREF